MKFSSNVLKSSIHELFSHKILLLITLLILSISSFYTGLYFLNKQNDGEQIILKYSRELGDNYAKLEYDESLEKSMQSFAKENMGGVYNIYKNEMGESFNWAFQVRAYRDVKYSFTKIYPNIIGIDSEASFVNKDNRFANPEICNLPISDNEIAISSLLYDCLIEKKQFGELNSPDEIIGKDLYSYKIVGVFSTNEQIDKMIENYQKFHGNNLGFSPYAYGFHLENSIFVNNKRPSQSMMLLDISKDLKELKNLSNIRFVTSTSSLYSQKYESFFTSGDKPLLLFIFMRGFVPFFATIGVIIGLSFMIALSLFFDINAKEEETNKKERYEKIIIKNAFVFLSTAVISLISLTCFISIYNAMHALPTYLFRFSTFGILIGIIFLAFIVTVLLSAALSWLIQLFTKKRANSKLTSD